MPFLVSPAARRVVDVISDVAIAASFTAGSALALSGSLWGSALVLAGVLALGGQYLDARGRGWMPLGRAPALQSAAAVAVGICLAGPSPDLTTAIAAALGAAILVGAIAIEQFVARSARFECPIAVGLPDLPVPPRWRNLAPLAIVLGLLADGAGLALVKVGASPWWWVLLTALAVIPVGLLVRQGRAKIILARQLRAQIPQAVARYAPEFVLYTSRPDDASYQILMWLPYLKRTGRRFIVVTRNGTPARALIDQTDVPIVEARGTADVDALVSGSLRAAFYVNASSGNGTLVRFQHMTHVYLGHGDSDKPPSYNPTHAMYDLIFAAGPAATRRYAAHGVSIPLEKFRIVGRPQVEDVTRSDRPIAEISSQTVLYAPTWRGHVEETRLSSLPTGERIVAALLARGARVIFRPHPFSYDFDEDAAAIGRIHQMLEADTRRSGQQHLWGAAAERDRSIFECINASDAMVSDVSSVVSDYLFSGKPFAMIAVPALPPLFEQEFPVGRAAYVVRGDLTDLTRQLDRMLGPDPQVAQRLAVRDDYLGDFPAEDYASVFVKAVRRVLDEASPTQSQEAPDTEVEAEEETSESGTATPQDGWILLRAWSAYRPLIIRMGLHLLGTICGVLAFAIALAGGPALPIALLALAGVASAFGSIRESRPDGRWWAALLAVGDGTRMVLALSLIVAAVHHADVWWPYVLTGLLVAVVTAAEHNIRSAWSGGLLVRHLPTAAPPIRELVPRSVVPWAGGTVILLGFITLVLGVTPVLALAPAWLTFLAVIEVLVRALWRAREMERGELRLRGAVQAYAPSFAVYFASTVGAGYQVGMWLPYFMRIGQPFVLITRTAPMLAEIDAICADQGFTVPLIYRPSLRSVEEIIVDSLTTAFYVNNAARNTHFIERREITHVWLNHGDSEKPACYNPVHAIYDLIFAAGQAGIDRYARHGVNIPAEKFRIVGRPQAERILPPTVPIATIAEPTVLYAPTWQGPFADSRVYSLPVGKRIVEQALQRGARVIFRAHPFNYRYADAREMIAEIGALLDADRATSGRQHLWGPAAEQNMTIEDCFNASDAMVSDVSAVVSDYLHSGKPFAMVSVGRTPEELVVAAPAAQAAYVLREDLSNLVDVFDDLLSADPLAAERHRTKIYYLGDFPDENYADGFLNAAREVIAGRKARMTT